VTLRQRVSIIAALLWCSMTIVANAHDIPAQARIHAFIKPESNRLELLVRAPMQAMQEIEFPTRGPGYLVVSRADQALRDAAKVWLVDLIDVYENGVRLPAPEILAARVTLPSDRSFGSYGNARAHVNGPPLADDLDLYWAQQLLDVLLVYAIQSDRSSFSIEPRLQPFATNVSSVWRFMPPDGGVRAFELGSDPGLVHLDPGWRQAAASFLTLGFWHILEGTDHLLFLLCLVVPFRRLKPLIVLVTAFTVAHSVSLTAAAFGFAPDALWFTPLIETLIAATIVYMALENIVGSNLHRRWMIAFAFGIVHGFGFSFLLRESFQFAGDHLVTALLAFNLGVEIGQIAVLLVLVPTLSLLFRHVTGERLGIVIVSALVTHTAWHWMTERWEELSQFPFPELDTAFLAGLTRALFVASLLAATVFAFDRLLKLGPRLARYRSEGAGGLLASPPYDRGG
jgi:hypothetical protein